MHGKTLPSRQKRIYIDHPLLNLGLRVDDIKNSMLDREEKSLINLERLSDLIGIMVREWEMSWFP